MKRFFGFCFLIVLLAAAPAIAGSSDPDQIRLSFEDDATSSLTVAWRTENTGITDTVCRWGETPSYGNETAGTTYTFTGATGLHHKVQITGLNPRTVYHLSCGDGGSHMFSDRTFITAPAEDDVCEPIRFAVLGDSRSAIDNGASLIWSTVMDWVADEVPDFVIFTGDAIAEGDHVDDGWDDFFDKSHDIGDQPFLLTWGNHDDRGGSPYPELFHMPPNDVTGTDDFWEMRYGPIHMFGLDTEHVADRWAVQRDWLHNTLGTTDAIWKFAAFHQPGYSSGTTHGQTEEVVDYWAPVFDDYHLDVAFQSHDHMYERTKPIYNDDTTSNYNLGTMYIVSGGAGAFCNPILNIWTWWYEVGIGTYHYTMIEINYDTMYLRAIDPFLGITLDEVTVTKPGIGDPTAYFERDVIAPVTDQLITFDAGDSIDPCGELADYQWDFGDGNTAEGNVVAQHAYAVSGEYTVTLIVVDADDNTDVYDETFTVDEAPLDDDTVDDDTVDDDTVDDDTVDDDVTDDDVTDDDVTDDDVTDDDVTDDDSGDDDDDDDDIMPDDDSVVGDDDDDDDNDDGCGC